MFFKERKIRKLKIKIAKYRALSEASERFTKGSTNSYFIDCYLGHLASLAEAEERLKLI